MSAHRPLNRTAAVVVAIFIGSILALGQRQERIISTWQPVRFEVALAFDDQLTQITATTDITVQIDQDKVDLIDLDFGSLPVKTVTVDGQPARFEQGNGKLNVHLNRSATMHDRLKVAVSYAGKPADGLILTRDADGHPSAIGDNWPDRVHNWIPCLDHPSAKASVKFTVTAPSEDVVTANGALVSVSNAANGTKTWVYNEARVISPYNMVVAVGQFATATLKRPASPVPISYYVSQSEGQFADKAFAPAVPSVLTFSNLIAPYPFKKLALIVGATRFGGMENANTIVFTPNFFRGFATLPSRSKAFDIPSGMEEVEAHEIAHQWFGDTVTEKTWSDLWLSEGFATYFAGIFLERNEGKEAFKAYMRQKATTYLTYEKQRRAPIFDTQTTNLFQLLNPNNYEKGAWVLHMLRIMLGEKVFFDGLKIYYNAHKDSTATSEDLRSALEKSSGRSLTDFFDRWIYKAGHPIYKASWTEVGKGKTRLTLDQMQADEPFLQPVMLLVKTASGERRVVITPAGKSTQMVINAGPIQSVIVDPDESILKEVVN